MEAIEKFWQTIIAILNLLLSFWGPSLIPPQCPIELWVFTDNASCGEASPTAMATLYADDTCRPTNSDGNDTSLLPGNYVAECSVDGSLVIKQSGCSSSSCDADSQTETRCNQDGSSIAATLYSNFPTAIPLQQSNSYSCFSIDNAATGTVVTFTVFGDCTLTGCMVDGEPL